MKINTKKILSTNTLIDSFLIIFMLYVIVITLYPFLNILAISFNDSNDTIKGGITIFPRKITLQNYEHIFKYASILHALLISISRTFIGTVLGVLFTGMLAFTLSREDYRLRKPITIIFVLTMYVAGGLIPEYMLIRKLGLINEFSVYIWPGLLSAFNIIVIRSFIEGLPMSLQESAKLDGANDLIIFFRIIFPLCKPVLATIGLFIAVGQWNSWFDTFIYASGNEQISTLQYEMMKILQNTTAAQGAAQRASVEGGTGESLINVISPESIRMAITIVATVPIVVIYPFVQKYFVKGLTLGAVKN